MDFSKPFVLVPSKDLHPTPTLCHFPCSLPMGKALLSRNETARKMQSICSQPSGSAGPSSCLPDKEIKVPQQPTLQMACGREGGGGGRQDEPLKGRTGGSSLKAEFSIPAGSQVSVLRQSPFISAAGSDARPQSLTSLPVVPKLEGSLEVRAPLCEWESSWGQQTKLHCLVSSYFTVCVCVCLYVRM